MFPHLNKHIELIQLNKKIILEMWMSYDVVQERLCSNALEIKFFQDKFASKVFDFSLSILLEENKNGDCPVINVMLMLFKRKNIPLSDIFLICVHFKNALLHFAEQNSFLNANILEEIAYLTDKNFEGVIKEYVSIYYNDTPLEKKSSQIVKSKITPQIQIINQSLSPSIGTNSNQATTSAKDYFNDVNIEMEMVDELDELENDTLNALESQKELNQHSLHESANLFEQYAKVLNMMYEFDELAYTLTLLKELLNNVEFTTLSEDIKSMVTTYLEAIIADLRSWRISIFILQDAQDIHYLDKTLLSSIAQIQLTLSPSEETEDEIEFF